MVIDTSIRSKRIVVVDDSPTTRKFVSDTLRSSGFEVFTANDGEAATGLVNQIMPDLVVLDIILPKKNGFQVCRELKTSEATRDINIVLLSSKSKESDRFWGQRQGADAYLTKPVNPDELLTIVSALAMQDSPTPHSDMISNQGNANNG